MSTPDLTVVISTHRRPEQLRQAIAAIRAQDLDGVIETIVVHDKEEPDLAVETSDARRPVRAVANHRTPGLPGTRNAGVDLSDAPVVGFCDDDDLWKPEKASRQLELMARTGAPTVGCSIEIVSPEGVQPRRSTGSAARLEDLVRTRIPEAYMGTVLVRRDAFLGPIGPVDEQIPGGFSEDYDWWVRAARHAPVPLVQEPLFQLRWGHQSFFRDKWDAMEQSLGYMVDKYPEFAEDRKGLARIQAQRAFADAAQGKRGEAWGMIGDCVKMNWREPRTPLAAAVAMGVPADKVMAFLNRRGRGI
jgi:glycosyltransferase involved in cell wall biosynthesis